MVNLSVNLNKVALIRNSRGANYPDLTKVAKDCEMFGAQGITVHPRPDERHARYSDLAALKEIVKTEFNVEGYPSERFLKEVEQVAPHQCTLVPDPPGALTSDTGWDTLKHMDLLSDVIARLKSRGIRVSIFLNPDVRQLEGALKTGTDRIEFYTGPYARDFNLDRQEAISPYRIAAIRANELGLGINAGHDLNLENLEFFRRHIPNLQEVSIGHALISDALYYGLHNTIQMYLAQLKG